MRPPVPRSLRFLIILGLLVVGVSPGLAQERLPAQVLYLPLPVDPSPERGRAPVSVSFHEFEFPDERRGQLIRVGWWTRRSDIHSIRVSLDYVGLESAERFRYGGGRGEAQWAARYAEAWPVPIAFDVAVTAPLGDATLHPLSAKAPALRGRVRVQPIEVGPIEFWLGVGGRMVSPPGDDSVRDAPLASFPSGPFVDAALRVEGTRWHADLAVRQGLGALPEEATWTAGVSRVFTADLALRLGGGVSIGRERARLFDRQLFAALVWSPAAGERGGSRGDERPRR